MLGIGCQIERGNIASLVRLALAMESGLPLRQDDGFDILRAVRQHDHLPFPVPIAAARPHRAARRAGRQRDNPRSLGWVLDAALASGCCRAQPRVASRSPACCPTPTTGRWTADGMPLRR